MQAKYAIRHDSGHGTVVKGIGEVLPNIRVAVLAKAFVIKSVHLSDLPTFVIAPQDCDSVALSKF